ncbi:2-hydroxychromene-2-carboxylate isomerase [Rubricella aquisinus]|uniref:2-hydroxychromene-2-carboxylate isomerase n=1 Tax=Rubricella aquisinus TaxID=2028108 RepID=A0A840WSB4_9RHOB|nr:2-hydroxychromene-2-carboxylate isomerase [Rubricella aquisinus]MBB5514100.1 2-hydroxychromene-2-carboxylate isomerase [Rubricella aquisinus]
MAHIDYYLFLLSPFTYLSGMEMEEIAARHGATVTYKPFILMDVFAETGGTPLPQRHPSRQKYRLQELARIAKMRKMPINLHPAHWPTNPVPASAAIIAAQNAGGGDVGKLTFALLRSVWADERNIAEEDVIRDCLSEAGFDPDIAASALFSSTDTYERNTKEAIEAGVFGAPSYVVGDEVFFGQDRLAYLDAHLAEQ